MATRQRKRNRDYRSPLVAPRRVSPPADQTRLIELLQQHCWMQQQRQNHQRLMLASQLFEQQQRQQLEAIQRRKAEEMAALERLRKPERAPDSPRPPPCDDEETINLLQRLVTIVEKR